MALTRMTAKNTFGEGLIMDFAPDNTLATVLTNALNATLLTYNGNEMSLQNDMGNGRVETAFLPEGYIPMGTCEFGGIIYIVSYNPLDNLCQIGSFPSPERNITKDDKLENSLNPPSLSPEYFQEGEYNQNRDTFTPTGKLNSLVAKVIIREDSLNPGDKYIVTGRAEYSSKDLECLSFLNAENEHKRVKLSVVSIEDSGKITKLNTTNYKVNTTAGSKTYNIANSTTIPTLEKTDLDLYRKTLSQNYSVFDAKIPGKLAVLAELEVINAFSCGHKVITSTFKNDELLEFITYDVYLDYKWESEEGDLNPAYITLTDFTWKSNLDSEGDISGNKVYAYEKTGKSSENMLLVNTTLEEACETNSSWNVDQETVTVELPKLINVNSKTSNFYHIVTSNSTNSDSFKNYEYKTSIYNADHKRTLIFEDTVNHLKIEELVGNRLEEVAINNDLKLSNTIYLCSITVPSQIKNYSFKLPYTLKYEVTPAMDFGLLEHLAVNNEIDFSLIGTKLILPTGLKYFSSSDLLTLNINSDIYEEENHQVTKLALEFYDHVGFCGTYIFDNRESYSGNLVANIPFTSIYLSTCKYGQSVPQYHNVEKKINDSSGAKKADYDSISNLYDTGDCGVLYPNLLYGVKLIYEYSELDPITKIPLESNKQAIPSGFWLYTDGQFNDFYYSSDDFTSIVPELTLQYSYKLKDRTSKSNVRLTDTTLSRFSLLLNADYDDLEKFNSSKNNAGEELTTLVDYKGNIDMELSIGVDANSIYGLMEHTNDWDSDIVLPEISLKLMSPYKEGATFAIIEQSSTSDDENSEELDKLSNSKEEYDYSAGSLTLTPKNGNKISSLYTKNASIYLKMLGIPFKVIPKEYKKGRVNTTILTPILYKQQSDDEFNYLDVGGQNMFTSAICYTGSDDPEGADGTSDDCWYETFINDNDRTNDSLLYLYSLGAVHKNLLDGLDLLTTYYDGLGNRQPFTLFSILRPEPDANSGCGYSVKWTHNIQGPGNVYTKGSDKSGYQYDYGITYNNMSYSVIHKLAGNDASEYSPDYRDRSYIPAFVTNRIATGGSNIAMSSAGGTCLEHSDTLYYTAHTAKELRNGFYKPYLLTLKEMLTVNPDFTSCEMGTLEYDETSCNNLELISIITALLNKTDTFKNNAKSIITIHKMPFIDYINGILNKINEGGDVLTDKDSNISIIFNLEQLGEGTPVAITYINYIMLHEHELIDLYINNEESAIVLYTNGYYRMSEKAFRPGWSSNLFRTNIPINENKFYMLYRNEKDLYEVVQIDSLTHKTTKSGNILYIPTTSTSKTSPKNTGQQYTCYQNPIFYNTSMRVDDFVWDPSNNKHHFYFNNELNLMLVDSAYSYLLDDDYGEGGDHVIVRPYYIGPSFDKILQ